MNKYFWGKLITLNPLSLSVLLKRASVKNYSKTPKLQYFVNSAFSVFEREIRKNKNLYALLEAKSLKIIVVSLKIGQL